MVACLELWHDSIFERLELRTKIFLERDALRACTIDSGSEIGESRGRVEAAQKSVHADATEKYARKLVIKMDVIRYSDRDRPRNHGGKQRDRRGDIGNKPKFADAAPQLVRVVLVATHHGIRLGIGI